MQKNESILEVANNIIVLKSRFKTVSELKVIAFTPYCPDYFYSLGEVDEFQKAWYKLFRLDYVRHYFYGQFEDLDSKLNGLKVATTSRKEFIESPSVVAACEGVEKCIVELKEKISLEEKKLDTLYNKFVKKTGDLSFIFKDSKIKQIIIDELLLD